MKSYQRSQRVFHYLLNLNFWIVMILGGTIARSMWGYQKEGTAHEFLKGVTAVPVAPWKVCEGLFLLYLSLLCLFQIKEEGKLLFCCRTVLELFIGLLICYLLNFSYSGIFLLVLADVACRLADAKWKFAVIGFIGLSYLFADFYLIPDMWKTASLESCLLYYQGDIRTLLYGIRNVMVSLNLLFFIAYILFLIREQIDEKERIVELNAQLHETNLQLQQANEQLEAYAEESVRNAETRERNRLAREIHDTLGHTLTGIIAGLDACTMLIDVAPDAVKQQIADIADVARKGMTDVRRSVKALRPDALEKLELSKALTEMIDETSRSTKTEILYTCNVALKGFNPDEEEIIYRIVQESITNAIRHGKANRIVITMEKEYQTLTITIQDNGIGCKDIQKGFGLHHMEERLSMLQGSLRCNGDNGFFLEAKIPIRWGEENE